MSTDIQTKILRLKIKELEAKNDHLETEMKKLQATNHKLYENIERFVTRKTINDFSIDD